MLLSFIGRRRGADMLTNIFLGNKITLSNGGHNILGVCNTAEIMTNYKCLNCNLREDVLLHNIEPELRLCKGSNAACGMSEILDSAVAFIYFEKAQLNVLLMRYR